MHSEFVNLHSLHYPIVHLRVEDTCIRSSPREVAHLAGKKKGVVLPSVLY